MKVLSVLLSLLLVAVLASPFTWAQNTTSGPPCSDSAPPTDGSSGSSCAVDAIGIGDFHATPFTDACDANGNCSYYGDPANNIQSLYGSFGNTESTGMALTHFTQGTGLAGQIVPLCTDGSTNNCSDSSKAIVALIIGFSNCDIEVCGGSVDA